MGAVMRREQGEIHFSTGKLRPEGEPHLPEWSDWFSEHTIWMRQCRHPDCDLDDYSEKRPDGLAR